MSLRNRSSAIFACTTICLNASAGEAIHVVTKGETLSTILYHLKLKPIYGKDGTLKETLQLNPNVSKRKDYRIFPGEKIKLATTDLADQSKISNNEIPLESAPNVEVSKLPKIVSEPTTLPQPIHSTVDRLPSDEFKQSFYWKLGPALSWKALTSTDENVFRQSNIKAISQTCYGGAATYGMRFEENLEIYSRISLEKVPFQNDNSLNLTQRNFLSTSFSFGGVFQKKYAFELGMDDQFFLTSSTSNSIEIKKITLPRVNFSYSQSLYQNKKATIGALLSGRAILPRSTSELQTKLGFGAGAEFQFKLMNQSFGIGYDYNILKSQSNTTNSQNIFWKYLWETI